MRPNHRGFTLIELMIVVAIIAILAVVAVPKFGDLLNKSREGSVKGMLGAFRSALSIYYADTNIFPSDVETALVTGTHYFSEIPVISIPPVTMTSFSGHANVTSVKNVAAPDDDVATGAFAYVYSQSDSSLMINCTHRDSRGTVWSAY